MRGKYHVVFFVMLSVIGLSYGTDLVWQHPMKNHLDSLCIFAAMVLGIVALIKQHGGAMTAGLRQITWIGMVGLGLLIFASQMALGFSLALDPSLVDEVVRTGRLMHGVLLDPLFAFSSLVFITLGVIGLLRLQRFRAKVAGLQAAQKTSTPGEAPTA